MKVVKCKNGHFYDADIYQVCPHCKENGEDLISETKESQHQEGEKKKGFFSKIKEKKNNQQEKENTIVPEINTKIEDKTESLYENYKKDNSERENEKEVFEDNMKEDNIYENHEREQVKTPENSITEKSLSSEIKSISASSEGKTLSYFNATMKAMNSDKETSDIETVAKNDPITGWLVCVKGPHFGQSFEIVSGNNTIGRGEGNMIRINLDGSVSREKHAKIIFEPKKRKFYLQPGDSSGLTYLNDDFISENKELKKNDLIEIGNSKFLFIPLCGEDFSWEEYV